MKINYYRLITQTIFIGVAFLFCLIISLGVELDFERLKDWDFYAEVGAKAIFMIAVYNLEFDSDNTSRRTDKSGRFYYMLSAFRNDVDIIHKNNYYDKLAEEVGKKNDEIRANHFNKIIKEKGSSRVSYKDFENIESLDEVDEICKHKLMNKRAIRRVRRAVNKVFSGKIKIRLLDVDSILIDKNENIEDDGINFDRKAYRLHANVKKIIIFLGFTLASTIIKRIFSKGNIWDAIVENVTLIGSSIVSAIMLSKEYINLLTNEFEERHRFFENRVIGLQAPINAPPAEKTIKDVIADKLEELSSESSSHTGEQ